MSRCIIKICDNKASKERLCLKHYQLLALLNQNERGNCIAPKCNDLIKIRKLCSVHYQNFYHYGQIEKKEKKYKLICETSDCDGKQAAKGLCPLVPCE